MHVKYEGEEVNFTLVDVFNIQIKFYAIVLTCYETMNAKWEIIAKYFIYVWNENEVLVTFSWIRTYWYYQHWTMWWIFYWNWNLYFLENDVYAKKYYLYFIFMTWIKE